MSLDTGLFANCLDLLDLFDIEAPNLVTIGYNSIKFIEDNTGYKDAGIFSSTDITVLCEKICGVNLSVGYYYEHFTIESLNFNEWLNTLNIARKKILTMIRMNKLIKVFADTHEFFTSDHVLKEAVSNSI